MKKQLLILAAAMATATSASALDLKYRGVDYGTLEGQIKAMGILTAKDNGYDPNSGWAYMLKAKYITPSFGGLQAGAGAYLNGDLFGLTDFDTERVARGMFVADDGIDKGILGEIYATYNAERLYAFAGRGFLDTPLTKIAFSTIPNFYTAFRAGGKPVEGLDISLGQITQMSFGARAMTDFGLIGEVTGTAGASQLPDQRGLGQAKFLGINEITLGPDARNTNGITAASISYSGLPYTNLQLWNYYSNDISNNVYFQADGKVPVKKMKLDLGFQYLRQDDVGEGTTGIKGPVSIQKNFGDGKLDFNLIGLKAGLIGEKKKWSAHVVYNHSEGDSAFLNAYGSDPAYTSTIFSRNAYRKDVDAWGLRGMYKIMPGLVFKAQYMNYGKSDTVGLIPNFGLASPNTDAYEWDLILAWKPKQVKGLTLKTFYANRISEYDGFVRADGKKADASQSHWRIIGVYSF
ncbi:MAG: hypothetical protein U9Q81_27500 [Pseudomonadota bacterium]|nr:hypothetical protein [Pseudomonadota bacterium]